MAILNFDASQVAPDTGSMQAVPADWYNVAIDQSEMKPTKDGAGAFLEVRYSILDGQYANRKIYDRLNLRNSNPVAQDIAYRRLSAIGHAVGVLQIEDSSQLHGRPLKIRVKVRPATDQYEASNEIAEIKNINEVVAPAPGQAAPMGMAPQATPAGFGAPAGFGTPAPVQQAPVQQAAPQFSQQAAPAQPWAQPGQATPAQQPAPQAAPPAWAAAPQAQPVQQAAPAQQFQQPVQQAAPLNPNPQVATPPWAQPAQG